MSSEHEQQSATEHDALVEEVRRELDARFGDALFFRSGPPPEFWRSGCLLEIFPRNTGAASAEVHVDSLGIRITVGDGIDCVFEARANDAAMAIDVLSRAGSRGIEKWKDGGRHLFGGQNRSRIAGEPWEDVSHREQRHLVLVESTEPWPAPGMHSLPDPAASGDAASAFLVDDRLPEELKEIAVAVRREFGSTVSVVTRPGRLGDSRLIEILPSEPEATRMRIRRAEGREIETSSGHNQYVESEFEPVPSGDPMQWVLDVGRFGLLETTVSRGRGYRFVNGSAHAEAVRAAESTPSVSLWLWRPWGRD